MSQSELVRLFQEFHMSILKQKIYIENNLDISDDEKLTIVQNELISKIKFQHNVATQTFPNEVAREYQYIITSLVDETFLQMSWRELWLKNLLEEKFFQSHNAGSQIFTNIKDLLNQTQRMYRHDLCCVYLSLLGLEFLGKYSVISLDQTQERNEKELQNYCYKLFNAIHHENVQPLSSLTYIMPDNYKAIYASVPSIYRESYYSRWIGIGTLIIYAIFGTIYWNYYVEKIQKSIDKVMIYKKKDQDV